MVKSNSIDNYYKLVTGKHNKGMVLELLNNLHNFRNKYQDRFYNNKSMSKRCNTEIKSIL